MNLEQLKKHPACYYSNDNGVLLCGDCLEILPNIGEVDLTITSPPYDNIRDYLGYTFNFKGIAKELYHITKDSGTVVWVVNDARIDGSETGTSFKQALYFKEIGFNLTTMLYVKKSGLRSGSTKFYQDVFEYVFVLTKGAGHTFNPIKDKKNNCAGEKGIKSKRQKEGSLKKFFCTINPVGQRNNVWQYNVGYNQSARDDIAYQHPAIFPEALAQDHIISWSNKNDIVLEPMAGSGTVAKMCERLNRKWIGIETSETYCSIIKERIENERKQFKLFT